LEKHEKKEDDGMIIILCLDIFVCSFNEVGSSSNALHLHTHAGVAV
jgi:hypothetical protein